MSKRRLTDAFFVFGLLTLVCTATAEPLSTAANRHCVMRLVPLDSEGSQPIPQTKPECYPTFRDAIFFATGGIVLLPTKQPFSVQLEILGEELKAREEQLVAASTFVNAVDYQHINYGGASLIWEATGPCTPSVSWYKYSMPSGWNDVVSSTRGYSDCNKNILWEHSNLSGAKLTCRPNCSSVGSMNDKTSSRELHHLCEGVAGQWSGCRGTGCSVCAELVANYPCYFQNHPNCSSNSACGGLYFTCSDACPAPTQADTCNNFCEVTASCANAGGGSAYCSSNNGDCFAIDDCYASCDGFYYYCPNPPGICPL